MKQTTITNSFEETQKLGFDLAKTLKGGEVLCLHGDLGSGKTTFVQGLAKGLGVTQRIISPTFIIMRTYEINSKFFYHVDLYRIESEKDIEGLGLFEIMQDKLNIVAIEWSEKIEHLLPSKRIDLFFDYIDKDKRKIIIE
jgi:tRNA threonylcarbamoyladenosine biosynthesis protein TsaE